MKFIGDSLSAARTWLAERLKKGAECPCCGRYARMYRVKLNTGMAYALVCFFRLERQGEQGRWLSYADALQRNIQLGGQYGKLAYWGLMERKLCEPGRTKTSGLWRLTDRGRNFVRGYISLPSHVWVYAGKPYEFDGKPFTIKDALASRFDYVELMQERGTA